MRQFIHKILFVFSLSLILPQMAFSAQMFFESTSQEFAQGEEFIVSVFLNTAEESINAVEAKILFPEALLNLKEIRDGNSIVNFWIERPKIKKAGAIDFSGIIPGGYQGTKGLLFSAVFEAKESGGGAIEIIGAKMLLNDGKGTPANTQISNFQLIISEQVITSKSQILKDTEPPELFAPEIARDPNIFDGKWFLVFATQDKGSGMDHYKVCEKIKTTCVIAESPYVLQNQNLNRKIFVKAFDKNGNERAVVLPAKFAPWYKKWLVDIIVGLSIMVVVLLSIWLRRKYARYRG